MILLLLEDKFNVNVLVKSGSQKQNFLDIHLTVMMTLHLNTHDSNGISMQMMIDGQCEHEEFNVLGHSIQKLHENCLRSINE